MSEIDVSKCRFYLKDGSCSSMNEECTKCIHNYCDWKELQEQLQQLKAENEKLKKELKNVENDRKWIKERCIDAGKELGKHSFAWDGKEKNLVVQAMELNNMYEKLKAENELLKNERTIDLRNQLEQVKAENEDLKDSLGLANKYVNKYKTTLDEIEEQIKDNIHCNCRKGGCEVCSVKPLCDKYYILQLIKQAKEGE